MQWDPTLKLLKNVNKLLKEENPLTLRYLFIAMHDINLIDMLAAMGYDFSNQQSQGEYRGVDFNDSLRFEVYE